jgi:hypothetical protein
MGKLIAVIGPDRENSFADQFVDKFIAQWAKHSNAEICLIKDQADQRMEAPMLVMYAMNRPNDLIIKIKEGNHGVKEYAECVIYPLTSDHIHVIKHRNSQIITLMTLNPHPRVTWAGFGDAANVTLFQRDLGVTQGWSIIKSPGWAGEPKLTHQREQQDLLRPNYSMAPQGQWVTLADIMKSRAEIKPLRSPEEFVVFLPWSNNGNN